MGVTRPDEVPGDDRHKTERFLRRVAQRDGNLDGLVEQLAAAARSTVSAADHAALVRLGFSTPEPGGFVRYSKLLPPVHDDAAIIEVSVRPADDSVGLDVELSQGVSDDPHVMPDIVVLTARKFNSVADVCQLLTALTGVPHAVS